jgi:hypothetical protein
MAFVFPTNPTIGQKYTEFGKTWEWDGEAWRGSTLTLINAAQLGGLTASQFLRSDTSGTLNGALTVTGNVNISDRIVHIGDTNTQIRFPANDTVTVETNGIERLRITSSGRVGIGTSAPQSVLDISAPAVVPNYTAGSEVASNLRILNPSSDINTGPRISFGTIYSGTSNIESAFIGVQRLTGTSTSASAGAASLVFGVNKVGSTGTAEAMRINSAGNVGIATTSPTTTLDVGGTAAIKVPVGTTAQRPTPATGQLRFNSQAASFEGYNGSAWGSIGGGASGGGGDQVFYENDQTVTANYTIPADKNAMTTGPININSGVVITVSTGARWVII